VIDEFRLAVSQAALEDLHCRLDRARFPESQTSEGWDQGVPVEYARELVHYWRHHYDWRQREAYLNRHPQYVTCLDGLSVHFIHVRSPHAQAEPLIMTHGWPGSVVEFQKVIDPLVDPVAYGGHARDAFHVVCPSLPGYGFSGKPQGIGWGVPKIAGAWDELMRRLGYTRYFAQGGDWGSAVTTAIGIQDLGACAAIHVNMPNVRAPKAALKNPDEADQRALSGAKYYQQWGAGYAKQQSTRPQTLGYGLVDSPVGQAMWILEKFYEWTDCDGHPENVLSKDELLDNVMFYWLQGNGASSAKLYWESFNQAFGEGQNNTVKLPAGCSIFPREIVVTPRSWAGSRYENIVYWNELSKGGHFAAFEQPQVFVDELRACFALTRNAK